MKCVVRERESRESAGRVRNDPWKIYFYDACDVAVADAGVRDTTPKLNRHTRTHTHEHKLVSDGVGKRRKRMRL